MSTLNVSQKIQVVERKPVVRGEDMQEVIVAAERSEKGRPDGVSNAEAREIQLFIAKNRQKLDPTAFSAANAFMMRHNLPYLKNYGPMAKKINELLANAPLNEPMARAPRTGSLQPVPLGKDANGVERQAYFDVVKKELVLRVGEQGPNAKFYGPFPFDSASQS